MVLLLVIGVLVLVIWGVSTAIGAFFGILAAIFGKPKPDDKVIWRPYQDDEFPEQKEEKDES